MPRESRRPEIIDQEVMTFRLGRQPSINRSVQGRVTFGPAQRRT